MVQWSHMRRNWRGIFNRYILTNKEEIVFKYGEDDFLKCGWSISDHDEYLYIARIISRNENYECRVAKAPGMQFYIPFTIPFWGVVENNHLHVDTHMNYIFHAYHGDIIGATAYPVQDRFQTIRGKDIIHMHGVVKWFDGQFFKDLTRGSPFSSGVGGDTLIYILIWCAFMVVLTCIFAMIFYRYSLKPKLIEKYIKQD
eukprot:TRINITY_DN1035_c0_g1_i7.p1 TRINITY_DN1035_c0_g1~~TRINITY_DN1035_c0_g1_i7.p1  ORF type:complete len:199 (+),score=17.52 TRINITY_DN1035_c0_g1_i7:373-969(+)